jgi:hypothetical protein
MILKFSGQILKKTIITLQALRFKLNCLNQAFLYLKSIMQLSRVLIRLPSLRKEGRIEKKNHCGAATFIEKRGSYREKKSLRRAGAI